MKKKIFCVLITAVLLFSLLPLAVSADTGPKPSVRVNINGIDGEYYVTLLSYHPSNGPMSAWNGNESYAFYHEGDEGYDIWKKFAEYKDTDGYYFLQQFEKCEGEDEYSWTYYPPSPFKVLIYVPETDEFFVSGVYERYAFDSYFTLEAGEEDREFTLKKSYDYGTEVLSLVARIILTLALEIGLAFAFGYTAKKQLLLISSVNVFTQIVLNVLLNLVNFYSGHYAFVAYYVFFELIVFALEAVIFYAFLHKFAQKPKKRALSVAYAASANALSFALGMVMAKIIPGIF